MGRICMATRDEVVVAVAGRYARTSRLERGRVLGEFMAVTGRHRKHARPLLLPASAFPGRMVASSDDFGASMTDAAQDLLDPANAGPGSGAGALCLPLGLSMRPDAASRAARRANAETRWASLQVAMWS